MKTIKKLILIAILILPALSYSQVDCSTFLDNRVAEPPFEISSLSKSAACVTGHTYELTIPLQQGKEYRILFYASPLFDRKINFKIVDLNTGETVLDLPGATGTQEKGTAALEPYWDPILNKSVHPYFDFIPQTSTNLKIIIDVEKQDDIKKGCVGVLILTKDTGGEGFN